MSSMLQDKGGWAIDWQVTKWDADMTAFLHEKLGRDPVAADFAAAHMRPGELVVIEGNLLTTAGIARIHSLIIGGGGQAATNTACRIGVGNSSTAAAVGDTDLNAAAGSANRQFVVMDATFPTAGALITFQSTFTSALGNFAWNEMGIDVAAPTVANGTTVGALLLNHKAPLSPSPGTKGSGSTWTAVATITIS